MSDTVSRWIDRAQKVTFKDQVLQFAGALYWHEWVGKSQPIPWNIPNSRPPSDMGRGCLSVRMNQALRVSILTGAGRVGMVVEPEQYLAALSTLSNERLKAIQRFLERKAERDLSDLPTLPPALDRSRYKDQLDALGALYIALGGPQ